VLWRSRKSGLTIPAELHEKLSRVCQPVDQAPSEVLRVRMISSNGPKKTKTGLTLAEIVFRAHRNSQNKGT